MRFGEVEAGDLEAVEEEACAARIDFVGGDALEDFADGGLDGAAVFGDRDVEFGLFGAAVSGVSGGAAGGVVVVAEFFVVQAGAAAAVAVGKDVAALEALGCFGSGFDDGVLHVSLPTGLKVYKVFKRKDLSPYFGRQVFCFCGLKTKARLVCRALLYLYFYCSEMRETKMPLLARIFLDGKLFILLCLFILVWDFGA